MIIDTERLREEIDKYFSDRCHEIDKIKNDSVAIREFTHLEIQGDKWENAIRLVEEIVKKIGG